MKIDIEFKISGLCYQTLELFDNCTMSREEVIEGLNDGTIITMCGDIMAVLDYATGKPVGIGRIDRQMFEADYYDFVDNS